MRDPLLALSRVKFLQAQFAGEELNQAADKQEETVKKMKLVRDAQEAYDAAVADGSVTETERNNLQEAMEAAGIEPPSSLESASGTQQLESDAEDDEDEVDEAADNKAAYDAINNQIENAYEALKDDQSLQEFDMQILTDEYTNASNMMSTHQSKMDKLREEIQRRLDG